MDLSLDLSKKSFAIYGLGKTGRSIIKYFDKIGFKNYITWDDNKSLKRKWNLNERRKKIFKSILFFAFDALRLEGILLKLNSSKFLSLIFLYLLLLLWSTKH